MQALLRRLANRDRVQSEATLQADVRQLLLSGGLNLAEHDLEVDLETQVGDRRRIDIEIGFTAIEIKKSLRSAAVLRDAERQLHGYVTTRSGQVDQPYVGILTDGATWRAYRVQGAELALASEHTLKATRPDGTALLLWLEGVLCTQRDIPPTPVEIARRLGATSTSYYLDRTELANLYSQNANLPTVQLKRQLWARLLRTALGTQFEDNDALFIEHTLLVNSAEIIAHLVLGISVTDMQPASILRGQRFDQAQIYGVVEQDFFDWVLEVPGGADLVRTLARRLSRFAWGEVEHDVLKVLYESVIETETRKRLGEYYTPDWLAEQVVTETVRQPLASRVLDPACGSGTFLFHAARRYLEAADAASIPLKQALEGLTRHVVGIDLHPVAVALARVTYVLAIGRDRLVSEERGAIGIPVYLGDSVQWTQRQDLFDQEQLVIRTGTGNQLFENELRFPDHLLEDAGRFDRLVTELADLAARPRQRGTTPSINALANRLAIGPEDRPGLDHNFRVLCELVDEGRNHIWSYYVRNLARPMWMSRPENRADVMVGNPPWLSYRHMPADMQQNFRELATNLGIWQGQEVASHQDLSGLFIARTVQQYLASGGSFGFVMPNAVLDRAYWRNFRTGKYLDPFGPVEVDFATSWDLRRIRPHFFPRGAAVLFGKRASSRGAKELPRETIRFIGKLPRGTQSWQTVRQHLSKAEARLSLVDETLIDSPYKTRFENGATIYPRILFFVDIQQAGPLGLGRGRTSVRSTTSSNENSPWKELPRLEGVVETEFVRPVLLGESILAYRSLPPRHAVLPIEGSKLLSAETSTIEPYPRLTEWWSQAEEVWASNRSTDRLSLLDRLNFRNELIKQLPGTPLRVVYSKSGMHVAACLVDSPNVIIENTLYWATVTTREEGWYLCAILNTPTLTDLVRPLMSYGKDERHIDKHLWKLPIPLYDAANPTHRRLAELGAASAERVANLDIDMSANFVTLRRRIREHLAASPHADELEEIVVGMLDQ
ncbi:N-6 DNA methylase [Amycolatopsis samaneae]|uniref:N-6 DNA methylase n=1 Tax=Amycolatopsis samaneae TaxID=664691 RepID=A0ABW5GI80_9PSEU